MAKNKVVFGDTTIMDITDTTAEAADVADGKVFYGNDGVRRTGTGNYGDATLYITGDHTGASVDSVDDGSKHLTVDVSTVDDGYWTVDIANSSGHTSANTPTIEYVNNELAEKADTSDIPTMTSELTNDGDGTHNFVTFGDEATSSEYGVIKTNPSQNIDVNANGQLEVGGRLGQTAEGGLYNPPAMNPTLVDKNALLMSGMSGLSVANGALALLRGSNVTVQSAPAGTTEYHVSNTYTNRLICAGLQTAGAVCIINEAAEPTGDFSTILSCTIAGAAFVPHTGADDPDNDIVIVVDKTCNPDSAVTQIRCYPAATKSSSFYAGQMVGGGSGLANVIVGQNVFSPSGNVVAMIAAQSYNTGNGNAIFGRYHNSRKNRWFMSGTGHDTTNGRSEAGAVVGQYSDISPKTIFAVGNGTNQLNRYNAFEVTENDTKISNIVATAKQIVFDGGDYDNLAPALVASNWGTSDWSFADGVLTFTNVSASRSCTAVKAKFFPVTAGETLTVSFEAKKATADGSIGDLQAILVKTNAEGTTQSGAGAIHTVIDKASSDITTEWATYTATFTVPSGVEYLVPRISKWSGTATTGQEYHVRNFIVSRPMDKGIIMTSPNGTKYQLVVDDSGNLSTTAVT